MVSLCHLVNRGFQELSMRTVVFLELIICQRPILFEHNCTFNVIAPLYLSPFAKCLGAVVHHQRVHLC